MKKRLLGIIVWTLLLVISTVAVGFADNSDSSSIKFTKDSYEILTGDEITLYLSGDSENAAEWSTTDETVAAIYSSNTRSAVIRTYKKGKVSITAKAENGETASCSITINPQVLKLSTDNFEIGLNNSKDVSVIEGNGIKRWYSSNSDIASVYTYSDNKKASITANGLGVAIITVEDNYGAFASIAVSVVESYLELETNKVELDLDESHWTRVPVISGTVSQVISSDETLVKASLMHNYSDNSDYISIDTDGYKIGNAVITVIEENGAKEEIEVSVTTSFVLNSDYLLIDMSCYDYYHLGGRYIEYGDEDDWWYEYDDDYKEPRYRIGSYADYDYYEDGGATIYAEKGYIDSARSLNEDVVIIQNKEIWPVGPGTATVECTDKYGQTATFVVEVTPSDFGEEYLKNFSTIYSEGVDSWSEKICYGDKSIHVECPSGSTVAATIGGTVYEGVLEETEGIEYYTIYLPRLRAGQTVEVSIAHGQNKYTKTYTVKSVDQYYGYKPIAVINSVYKNTSTITVRALYVKKGDMIYVKIGSKTYKKKVTKNARKYIAKIKVKKNKKAGQKITLTLKDKNKKILGKNTSKVKGKTKKSSGGKVYWVSGGSVYHVSRNCRTLKNSKKVYSGTKKQSGKKRCCKVCG